ncbi:MAG: preprotein translocase subunit SecA, partial [bacterium]
MLKDLFRKYMSNPERELKKFRGIVERVNALESKYVALTDEELLAQGRRWREEFDNIRAESDDAQLLQDHMDAILPDVFAAVRTAAQRAIGQRHFDVQLIGGAVLHQGRIAEMKTGEGKTLVATLPISLNGLVGNGVHLITVNDYLAKRDAQWMQPIYEKLGLNIAFLQNGQYGATRRALYAADITYGTNSEFGFD